MSFKIVRNDITKMKTDAIVNTASAQPGVGTGCDSAVYRAAGLNKLLAYREEKIGYVPEGEAFITPGFKLHAKYIIHAVSPLYRGGTEGEEEMLRSCYRKSLQLAKENGIRSLAFPLIATGGYGYPKEEGMRIAVDEITAFLLNNEMDVFLVVFDDTAKKLGKKIDPKLEEYIDRHYVEDKHEEEYGKRFLRGGLRDEESIGKTVALTMAQASRISPKPLLGAAAAKVPGLPADKERRKLLGSKFSIPESADTTPYPRDENAASCPGAALPEQNRAEKYRVKLQEEVAEEEAPELYDATEDEVDLEEVCADDLLDFETEHESRLQERIRHLSDTFSQYLLYLIKEKKMENAEVYKRAIVDKKIFSKIKNNADYHPQKITALCLCVGARLNLDESKDLLARAGYALSPCDKTDIIFSYFIENGIYDMIELDIQLEEHGLPCIIS